MAIGVVDPVVQDIRNGLKAKLDATTVIDADDYYLKAGEQVRISDDKTIIRCGAGEAPHGIALESIYKAAVPPTGIDARVRVSWQPYQYTSMVVRGVADGALAAGEYATMGAAAGDYKKAAALTATPPVGAVAVLSTGAQAAMTVAGTLAPVREIGLCWSGAANNGAVEIII